MAKLSTQQIKDLAKKIIAKSPGGIRYGQLVRAISGEAPETPKNTINGSIWNLETQFPTIITKPSRGLFKLVGDEEIEIAPPKPEAGKPRVVESDFYVSFSEWLKNDLDEVTDSVDLGGAAIRTKWGTPDVVGVYKPLASNLIKFPLEIVSAEIKTEPQAPVVAFGQAISYRLFSSKTYIVMPSSVTEEDSSRLEALCMLFGVGLVLFDLNVEDPNFTIRVRAQRFSPDMFYVNEFADRLRLHDPEKFEKLFR